MSTDCMMVIIIMNYKLYGHITLHILSTKTPLVIKRCYCIDRGSAMFIMLMLKYIYESTMDTTIALSATCNYPLTVQCPQRPRK